MQGQAMRAWCEALLGKTTMDSSSMSTTPATMPELRVRATRYASVGACKAPGKFGLRCRAQQLRRTGWSRLTHKAVAHQLHGKPLVSWESPEQRTGNHWAGQGGDLRGPQSP